jgi:hypothetical protein
MYPATNCTMDFAQTRILRRKCATKRAKPMRGADLSCTATCGLGIHREVHEARVIDMELAIDTGAARALRLDVPLERYLELCDIAYESSAVDEAADTVEPMPTKSDFIN